MSPYVAARRAVLKLLPKGGIGAELGVWKGAFSDALLTIAQPRLLHLVDPWQQNMDPAYDDALYGARMDESMDAIHADVCARFARQIADGTVRIHRMTSHAALSAMPADSLDYVYIDGDHSFAAVRSDLDFALDTVRPGGLICLDDYRMDKWWGDGVIRAVNQALGAHPDGLVAVFCANTQFVLRKR